MYTFRKKGKYVKSLATKEQPVRFYRWMTLGIKPLRYLNPTVYTYKRDVTVFIYLIFFLIRPLAQRIGLIIVLSAYHWSMHGPVLLIHLII